MIYRPILVLPPTDIQVIECEQSEAERDFYDALFKRSKVSLVYRFFFAFSSNSANKIKHLMCFRLRKTGPIRSICSTRQSSSQLR